jgi:hypothetical protein
MKITHKYLIIFEERHTAGRNFFAAMELISCVAFTLRSALYQFLELFSLAFMFAIQAPLFLPQALEVAAFSPQSLDLQPLQTPQSIAQTIKDG